LCNDEPTVVTYCAMMNRLLLLIVQWWTDCCY